MLGGGWNAYHNLYGTERALSKAVLLATSGEYGGKMFESVFGEKQPRNKEIIDRLMAVQVTGLETRALLLRWIVYRCKTDPEFCETDPAFVHLRAASSGNVNSNVSRPPRGPFVTCLRATWKISG